MRNLELPTPISPCLRLFVESLFDEVDDERGASWVSGVRLTPCALKSDQEEGILTGVCK